MALTPRAASTSISNILLSTALSTAVLVFACTSNPIFNIILILCIVAFIIMALILASASTSSSASAPVMALTLRAASTSISNILLSTAVLVFACTTNPIFNIILILCIVAFIIMALKLASASTSSSASAPIMAPTLASASTCSSASAPTMAPILASASTCSSASAPIMAPTLASASTSSSASALIMAPTLASASTSSSASAPIMAPTSSSASAPIMAPTLASASTSSSASARSNYGYDVFINHNGQDVKKTFASHLYHRLCNGVRVFLDKPEMQRGETIDPQIEGAIETASVQVAIFSPGYATSRWCLDELVLMMKSRESGSATVIPVFFNVKPFELRWTKAGAAGVYAQALANHKESERYTDKRIEGWREALKKASYISGFELEAYNGDEGQLLNDVVRRVQQKVKKTPLHVATYPIGLGEKLLDFETMVLLEEQHDRAGPNFVGIVGPGGVGKTALAKLFFNTKKSDYERSCFLAEVREAAARHTLPSHQRKLYQDLTGSDPPICSSTDEGIPILKRLPSFQALIILDDVDGLEQLEALFSPVKEVLAAGSLVLLTTRNKDILTKYAKLKGSNIYNMTGLNLEHSQELFCSHAFQQPYPAVGYENLVREFLNVCQGLPLSLKVIGSLLYSESHEYWKDQLRKLSQVVPSEIQDKLKISYDSLDKEVKEIFLDVACFFIGVNRDTAITVWDGSDWQGRLGVTILERRCLVTFDSENCIRMHDHLRDLGRDLADKEPPGYPRRLWGPIDKIFKNVPIDSKVRGISVVQRSGESFQSQELGVPDFHIKGLQLLRAPADCLESLFNVMTQPELLWLRCEIDSSSFLPSNWPIQNDNLGFSLLSCIPITNLRVLELVEVVNPLNKYPALRSVMGETLLRQRPIPRLETLWNTEIQAPPLQLREIHIDGAISRLPESIGQLKFLEKIELPNFTGTLPEEFFHLRSLKYLRLGAVMTSLPDSLGNFTNLQYIDLSGCRHLQTLPVSFGNLRKLQHIGLSGCKDLQTLPPSFGNLKYLQNLMLVGCEGLEKLPDSFMNLIRLKHLNLRECRNLTLSGQTLENIGTLERLDISHCKVEELPAQVTHQQSLEELILDFTGLKELPSAIGNLRQLSSLSAAYCPIREVPFASVEKIQAGSRLLDPSIDKCMLRLKSLRLRQTKITEISFGEGVCPVLQDLSLGDCGDLVEVGALPATLTFLDLNGCCELKKITGLHGLANLRYLGMNGCMQTKVLPRTCVRELNNLEGLHLKGCQVSVLSVMPFLVSGDSSIDNRMLRLKSLNLSMTPSRKYSFPGGVFPVLKLLDLSGCLRLEEVGGLPTVLTSLNLRDCRALKKITGLGGLARLRFLDMGGCEEIEEIPGLDVRELNNIEVLNLMGCPISVVTVLPFVSVEELQGGRRLMDSSIDNCIMPRLGRLYLSKTRITEISFGEGVCPVLEILDLSDCEDLVEVGALPKTLTSLNLRGCRALKKITGLRGLPQLRHLYIGGCFAVEELPDLETFRSLLYFQPPESEDRSSLPDDGSDLGTLETFRQAMWDLEFFD